MFTGAAGLNQPIAIGEYPLPRADAQTRGVEAMTAIPQPDSPGYLDLVLILLRPMPEKYGVFPFVNCLLKDRRPEPDHKDLT